MGVGGDNHVGMKAHAKYKKDQSIMDAIIAKNARYEDFYDRDQRYADRMFAQNHADKMGWYDHNKCHAMNYSNQYYYDMKAFVRAKGGHQYMGNNGHNQFKAVYWDAYYDFWVDSDDSAMRHDAAAVGHQAMADHYGFDKAWWAWW